jgi:hypothetical protein
VAADAPHDSQAVSAIAEEYEHSTHAQELDESGLMELAVEEEVLTRQLCSDESRRGLGGGSEADLQAEASLSRRNMMELAVEEVLTHFLCMIGTPTNIVLC